VLVFTVAYTLENAYELFSVRGLIRAPDPRLERSLALISLADAQALLVYPGRVSEVAMLARDPARVDETRAAVHAAVATAVSDPLDVNPWWIVLPELDQMLVIDDAQNYSMIAILVVVVGFGLLNTILMSVLERQRELGVMLALGLRPRAIFRLVYVESLLLSGIGLALGLALALPAAAFMQQHPIEITGEIQKMSETFGITPVITWRLTFWNPLLATLLMTALALLAALYPAAKAASARPVDALRSL
jgi:ABC-type lipoprotein release transport system permease subunit